MELKHCVFLSLAADGGNRAIALMMETASTSETSVNFYQTTRSSIPEESHLYSRRREKPKSHRLLTSHEGLFSIKLVSWVDVAP
jgi:hypothetical protein